MKIPRERKFTLASLGEVTLSIPSIRQVLDASSLASEQQSEIERAEAFLASLVGQVATETAIDYATLSAAQKLEVARAVASLLGAEKEFDDGDDDSNPAMRLHRAHDNHWKAIFSPLPDLLKNIPPLVDLDWVRKSLPRSIDDGGGDADGTVVASPRLIAEGIVCDSIARTSRFA
jgi:hypothetical protein